MLLNCFLMNIYIITGRNALIMIPVLAIQELQSMLMVLATSAIISLAANLLSKLSSV